VFGFAEIRNQVVEPTGPGRRNDGLPAGDYRVMTNLASRLSAPEYRGQGWAMSLSDQGEPALAEPDTVIQSPEQRQLKILL